MPLPVFPTASLQSWVTTHFWACLQIFSLSRCGMRLQTLHLLSPQAMQRLLAGGEGGPCFGKQSFRSQPIEVCIFTKQMILGLLWILTGAGEIENKQTKKEFNSQINIDRTIRLKHDGQLGTIFLMVIQTLAEQGEFC